MNTIKNYTTNHLRINQTTVLEAYRVCAPNKIEDLSFHVLNMITEKNESKLLTKDISCECKCRFDWKKI